MNKKLKILTKSDTTMLSKHLSINYVRKKIVYKFCSVPLWKSKTFIDDKIFETSTCHDFTFLYPPYANKNSKSTELNYSHNSTDKSNY